MEDESYIERRKMIEFIKKEPALIMMVGLPASGKSHCSELMKEENKSIVIHSSDNLRKELYDDVNSQEHNGELFNELHKRIRADLKAGKTVIYDATNINKRRRTAFLKSINCVKYCILMLTPYEQCLELNRERDKSVPDEVISRMYKNFQPPSLDEGFEDIVLGYHPCFLENYILGKFFYGTPGVKEGACSIEHENKHHTKTIGNHCLAVYGNLAKNHPRDYVLQVAGLLHDVGKPFTKTNVKPDGTVDTDYHYYNHQNVGAYDSFFYTYLLRMKPIEIIDVANIIYNHMLPFAWQKDKDIEEKHKKRLGSKMYKYIKLLHEADIAES